jgi:hypothetical protein
MDTKLAKLKECAAAGNWHGALRMAARFPQLGAERAAILDAHTAATNPRWTIGLGRNVEKDIAAGISALRQRYGI